MIDQITPLILTHDEAANIGRTLGQLGWARDIVIVDSLSDDETLEIIMGFPQVRVFQRAFDSFDRQWSFALKETGIQSDWVLALDADYVVSEAFAAELRELTPPRDTDGYRAKFIYCIDGKPIRSGIYPPVTVLYRRSAGGYVQDGHAHRLVLKGPVETLRSPILHDDRKPLSRWLQAQSRYTKLEAEKLLLSGESLSWRDRLRLCRIVAPPAVLFYCLIIRGGCLDGWAGFYYAFQRVLAEMMLSLCLIEFDLGISKVGPRVATAAIGDGREEIGPELDGAQQAEPAQTASL